MSRLKLLEGLAVLVVFVCWPANAAEVDAQVRSSDWHEIHHSGWEGEAVGEGSFDLSGELVHAFVRKELVETQWLRMSASAAADAADFNVWIHVFDDRWRPVSRVLPTTCSVAGDRKVCSNHAWIQPGGSHVRVAFYPNVRIAEPAPVITPGTVELASGIGQPQTLERFNALAERIRELYYRTDEVDWEAVIARAAEPARRAPANLDPLPTAVGVLVAALPGNRHTSLFRPESDTEEKASVVLPSCVQLKDGLWRLDLPRTPGSEDDSTAYVARAHDCLRRGSADEWLVNLTDNFGGDAFLQFAALAPILGEGPQMHFINARGESFAITLEPGRVRLRDEVMFAWDEASLVEVPGVRFVLGSGCGSSCEAVAIAVKGRFPTLGQPTAGYATANETLEVNDVYSLALTSGVMADLEGEIFSRVSPDVVLEDDALLELLGKGSY